jgi:hypothetical protein
MANGTWEEAKACPKCKLTGEQSKNPKFVRTAEGVTRGARLYTFTCRNARCRWFNTSWEVQVNPDGTIPDPDQPKREKKFKPLDPALAVTMKDRFQTLQEATKMSGGGEVVR